MNQIVVASTNPVKVQAAQMGYALMFPEAPLTASGLNVPSGVSDQPMSDTETLQGAFNRARAAQSAAPDARLWVGIEGGCEEQHGALFAFAWVVALDGERVGKARTGALELPHEVAALVRQGVELGVADDRVFGRSNSKHQNGAVGLLTRDVIDRRAYYIHAVSLALIPFRNLDLHF
jgi:inosine/xanthosine triphosphatase